MNILKKVVSTSLLAAFLAVCPGTILAEENNNACSLSNESIPEADKPILIEDNTTYYETRGAVSVANVNKTFGVRVQNGASDCSNEARITVTGTYTYDAGNGNVLSTDLSAYVSNVPPTYTCEITNQWTNTNGASINQIVNYKSHTSDGNCTYSGSWYNQVTLSIK